MNVLILSCGTGGGHNAAGAAVQKQLQKQGHQVVMINPYQLKSNRLAGVIDKVYIGLVQKNSTLFGFVYRLGELYRRLPFPSPVYYINRKMAYILQEYLLRHPADVIITPHLYPAEIITNMKKMGMEVPPSIFVATDYACIPFTEETDCDDVVIPSEKLIPEFRKYGIPKEKLYPLGIPTADGCRAHFTGRSQKTAGAGFCKRVFINCGRQHGGWCVGGSCGNSLPCAFPA